MQTIKGYKIPFKSKLYQPKPPLERNWTDLEISAIEVEIQSLLKLGAVEKVSPTDDQFISSFFLVPKPDGSNRFIINLKDLNEFIEVDHFKMEDMKTVCRLLAPGIFMGTIDLKDAYFLIQMNKSDRKYLRFVFQGVIYEFTCVPFGLCSAPFVLTKILKPIINILREEGFLSVVYLDDFLCMGLDIVTR